MPHAFLGRFANPSTLKEISPENLLLFFDPFRGYLTKRDYELPSNPSEQIDYDALASILANPDGDFPRDLAQRLYLVHEMATDRGMQDLLEAAPPGLLTVDGRDSTAADVALQVLLRDRPLLERTHAEQFLIRTRSFYVCRGPGKPNDCLPDCSGAVTAAISPDLDEWFDKHGRGRGSKVFTFLRPAEDEVWFLVRHGQPMGKIKATRKYENPIEFAETHKLWMDTNRKPTIRDVDDKATFNRLHPIPFTVTIPKDQIDKELPDKLLGEAEGILAWAVEGARLWYAEGLAKPAEVEAAKDRWREDMDQLGRFIDERCVTGDGFRARAAALYADYKQWATDGGDRSLLTSTAFGTKLTDRGITKTHSERGAVYLGIGLRSDDEQPRG